MEFVKKLARIVNKSAAGEAEHAVFQIVETNKIFEFSEVKFVMENNLTDLLEQRMQNNDLNHPIIQKVLNQGHTVMLSYYEPNKEVTLIF